MAREKRAILKYGLEGLDIDDVLKLSRRLQKARDHVLSKHAGIKCRVVLSENTRYEDFFTVSIQYENGDNQAVPEYVSLAGKAPRKVKSYSGLDDIEKALPLGKELQNKGIWGRVFGTYVINPR